MKRSCIGIILFFILFNISFYIQGLLGFFALFYFLGLALFGLILFINFCFQIYWMIKGKLKDWKRIYLVGLMLLVFSLTLIFPKGLLSYDSFYGDPLLRAYLDGVAGCGIHLTLYPDNTFISTDICFGVNTRKGTYLVSGDTISFSGSLFHDSSSAKVLYSTQYWVEGQKDTETLCILSEDGSQVMSREFRIIEQSLFQ